MLDQRQGLAHPIREIKAADDGSWTVAGYVSTFGNRDAQGDIVIKGAFAQTLKSGNSIKFLYGHDSRSVIGVPISLKEDEHGLFGRFRISKTSLGQDIYTLLKDGALDSFSIGYVPTEVEHDGENRLLRDIELLEASVVAIPANERALVTAVKERLDALDPPPDDDGEKDAPPDDAEAKPYGIRKRDGMFCVYNTQTGKTEKCHRTHADALAHQRALMVNVPDAMPGKSEDDAPPKGLTFDDHLARVLAEVESFATRATDYVAMRSEKGLRPSEPFFRRLDALVQGLETLRSLEKRADPARSGPSLRLEIERRRLSHRGLLTPSEDDRGSRYEAGGDALGARRPD